MDNRVTFEGNGSAAWVGKRKRMFGLLTELI